VTVMSGLNCGTPSTLAWPLIQQGLSAATTVSDTQALQALQDLVDHQIKVGPCGAAALSGIRNLAGSQTARERLNLDGSSVIVLLSTESIDANPLGTSA
jgi:diaminopropionate ammonia-lyase